MKPYVALINQTNFGDKLSLLSRHIASFMVEIVIFCPSWPWPLTFDLLTPKIRNASCHVWFLPTLVEIKDKKISRSWPFFHIFTLCDLDLWPLTLRRNLNKTSLDPEISNQLWWRSVNKKRRNTLFYAQKLFFWPLVTLTFDLWPLTFSMPPCYFPSFSLCLCQVWWRSDQRFGRQPCTNKHTHGSRL